MALAKGCRVWGWAAIVMAIAFVGCDNGGGGTTETDAGGGVVHVDAGQVEVRCGRADDPDMDSISSMDEGTADPDGDGRPNFQDDDSDGDGFLDRDEAGDASCVTAPVDTDSDGTPDFLDTDANGDGVEDRMQRDGDLDGDGRTDARDDDIDGDGILNIIECSGGTCPDTDGDATADVRDTDSDGDTITDAFEGATDLDGDSLGSYRDTDSDGDGVSDAIEAGDADVATPPAACANEIDPATGRVQGDGNADAFDADSDNDGFGDGEERLYGLDPCDVDSDDDGLDDLAEGAYSRVNCPDGTTGSSCDCGRNTGCRIPDEDFYLVLPFNGPQVTRNLDFGTTIRVADVFFITDTTGSMGGTLSNVKTTVTASDGLIDRITTVIPDAWIGGGQHDDIPFGGYGSGGDQPLIVAIRETPPDRRSEVQTAFNAIGLHSGNDGPESQTEALYQIITGEGGTWSYGGTSYTLPAYGGMCLDSGYGAPCFREAALPIIIHFTDICSHNGPPGEDSSCDDYTGITPAPHAWEEAIAAMNRRGAKYVGINVSGTACTFPVVPGGFSPCYFMVETARQTRTVDLDGNPLVYSLSGSAATSPSARAEFVNTVAGAVATIATRVPLDVDTGLRDDPADTEGVDATRFIKRREPACNATPPTAPCWTPPVGTTAEDAVARVDASTFYGVIPGTRVLFTITFHNDFVLGANIAKVYVAYIDVRAGSSSVLDTRQVYIVVPANSVPFG